MTSGGGAVGLETAQGGRGRGMSGLMTSGERAKGAGTAVGGRGRGVSGVRGVSAGAGSGVLG